MLAINWFEVFLSSPNLVVPIQYFANRDQAIESRKSLAHKTHLSFAGDQQVLYHLTGSPPPEAELQQIDLSTFGDSNPPLRSIGKALIEHGFANRLDETGFQVIFRHVGSLAYISVVDDPSLHPEFYRTTEGIGFRCFYGFDNGPNEPLRWGLVLKWISSQRFAVSLLDDVMGRLAVGKRVIRVEESEGEVPDSFGDEDDIRSGILESVNGESATIVDRDNEHHVVQSEQFTLPCSLAQLRDYVTMRKSSQAASLVASQIQQQSLALTSNGRINTSLAKDQLDKLRSLLSTHDLFSFRLHLPDQISARLSNEPLVISESG